MKLASPYKTWAWWGFVADLVLVLVFVLIGRSSHGEGDGVAGIGTTLWPFFVGTVVGWLGLVGFRWPIVTVISGVLVWIATVFIGMLLRVQTHQGIAVSFVIVASIVLGVFLIGWRVLALQLAQRRARRRA
ncbi:hypothetical protein AX769_09500 [Frondihabitans sp. PAMC 28766]|uniref:DUF3054 domain-containing protein n=1 Tax=Frondihabitans sp. PAMC 28766 TaxID=1795630 RepID=UPI00078D64C2|nr:DUF3054 domain-containing protein [Frondihabitans sp. PAMC 28766]AMM20344.1 hypothetical protein AX769_09500 [Frondihabitans sp. PAMC 28766]